MMSRVMAVPTSVLKWLLLSSHVVCLNLGRGRAIRKRIFDCCGITQNNRENQDAVPTAQTDPISPSPPSPAAHAHARPQIAVLGFANCDGEKHLRNEEYVPEGDQDVLAPVFLPWGRHRGLGTRSGGEVMT